MGDKLSSIQEKKAQLAAWPRIGVATTPFTDPLGDYTSDMYSLTFILNGDIHGMGRVAYNACEDSLLWDWFYPFKYKENAPKGTATHFQLATLDTLAAKEIITEETAILNPAYYCSDKYLGWLHRHKLSSEEQLPFYRERLEKYLYALYAKD